MPEVQAQGSISTSPLKLDQEEFGKAAEVFDGFWIIATRHRPGLSKHMFEINNRCLIFRLLEPDGSQVLLVANAVDPQQAFSEVHRLERETGLEVRYIVSPGGGHHMLLEPWHEEFTRAQVLIPPVRIPRISHGKKLMQLPRVSTLDAETPLSQFKGQLDAVLFRGLLGPTDRQSPGEGAPDTRLGLFAGMLHVMFSIKDPVDELWLHHVPSGTVIAGENLGWYFTKDALQTQPFMMRQMIKPNTVYIQDMARKVADASIVSECWRKVLTWPGRTVMTYHELPKTAYVGDGRAALTEAAKAVGQLH